jgi:hypothetical protein
MNGCLNTCTPANRRLNTEPLQRQNDMNDAIDALHTLADELRPWPMNRVLSHHQNQTLVRATHSYVGRHRFDEETCAGTSPKPAFIWFHTGGRVDASALVWPECPHDRPPEFCLQPRWNQAHDTRGRRRLFSDVQINKSNYRLIEINVSDDVDAGTFRREAERVTKTVSDAATKAAQRSVDAAMQDAIAGDQPQQARITGRIKMSHIHYTAGCGEPECTLEIVLSRESAIALKDTLLSGHLHNAGVVMLPEPVPLHKDAP